MASANILEITNLNVGFVTERGTLKALRDVDLTIPNGGRKWLWKVHTY